MLTVKNLVKLYPNAKRMAVNNISFELYGGEICGFLGMNGAGKSTTIKSITGIIPYTSGSVQINGFDLKSDPMGAKMQFGFVPDNHSVYEKLTGSELVNYTADIYKVDKAKRKERIDRFAKMFNLTHAMDNQIQSYSHGMKQKICIIAALIHNPKLWMLDEPMVGLDPQSIFEVKEYMREHVKEGNSVFFSSHSLDTVEKLCDRAIIVNAGRLLDTVNLADFRARGLSLEDHFLKIVKIADMAYAQELDELKKHESDLAKQYGKKRASNIVVKEVEKLARVNWQLTD